MSKIITSVQTDLNCNTKLESKPPHPKETLLEKAAKWGLCFSDRKFAEKMDEEPDLPSFRNSFHYPKMKDLPKVDNTLVNLEDDSIYFVGNSLGLLPVRSRDKVERELDKWSKIGVYGHLMGEMPWAFCDECVEENMASLVGAKRSEVTVMNGLTVNLHLQLVAFYRPTPERFKILLEAHSFPSDHYAIESQIKLHGYDPNEAMVLLKPREGEDTLREEDILKAIETEGDSISIILFPGVQYYTGQFFDMETITKVGQEKGCYVGWDLAHAAGNVELLLHDWGVDFACWCTYKYINTGAGGISGFFVHEKNFEELKSQPRLVGWWSHKMETRFNMDNKLDLDDGARGFRISNPPIMLCVFLEASLEIFKEAGMKNLCKRSRLLTGYLEMLLEYHHKENASDGKNNHSSVKVITPSDPNRRGAQLSLFCNIPIGPLYKEMEKRGIVCDKREPNVLRLAPAPLYNTFLDVFRFVQLLGESISAVVL